MTRCAECGAAGLCAELFQVVLALDHSRQPPWGPLHGVTVACFLLQHPSRLPAADRARPLALLDTFLDGGLPAVERFTQGLRRANHAGALPKPGGPELGVAPTAFDVTIDDVAQDGTFPADGFADRVAAWAGATVSAWHAGGRPPS